MLYFNLNLLSFIFPLALATALPPLVTEADSALYVHDTAGQLNRGGKKLICTTSIVSLSISNCHNYQQL